ncbi:rod shape-determining protein MreC [Usitatibacter palustris]|uniref:Cell shape-determining protein MreC n=1 Tax=Usitatibacter palustris TaxID=2732487 RepID=A0A6M4HAL2_9PROT|nr:rod shape-determining protein MreC [Usitatibacter palustris]QJR16839.1 Cell shape-determining protein MreC [Usitatibacter palustris]
MIGEPPPFFHRGPSPLARVTFFALVAIATMIADHRFQALEAVRLSLSVLAHPVQQIAALPGEMFGRVGDYFASQDRLMRENQDLKVKLLEQAAAAQQATLLKAEQEHLLAMEKGKSRFDTHGVLAEVLYGARNPFTRKIVVDKGLTHGMRAGMPAIDGEGVVGQITAVGTFTSEVTLLTEKGQSVPVIITRNGLRAIAVGSGKDGAIEVPFMPASADIQNGDLFVTSGIDGTYPPGLVVAKVTGVEKNAAFMFARIAARPSAGVDNFRYVMILPTPAAGPAPPDAKGEERKATGRDRPKGRR